MSSFAEEYGALQEPVEWAQRGFEDEDVVQMQATANDLKAFSERWKGKAPEEALRDLHGLIASLGNYLGALFNGELLQVLEKRKAWLNWQNIGKAAIPFLGIMAQGPAQLQPELRQVFRQHNDYEYDPERYYREMEATLESSESEYRQALSTLQTNWPQRATSELCQKLNASDPRAVTAWKSELAARSRR